MAAWEQELDALVRERGSALIGYAYLLCGDREQAQDLVQDALVTVFARGRAGHHPDRLESYVRRAVLNDYLDGWRRRRRWVAVRHLFGVPDADPDGEQPSTTLDDRTAVVAALRLLPERERTCVVLRFYEDLPLAEIAEALGLTVGAVKRYLHDAVGRLAVPLGPLPDAEREATADDVEVTTSRRPR